MQIRGPVTELTNDPLAERHFMRRFPAAKEHMVSPRFFMIEPETVLLGGDTLDAPATFERKSCVAARIDPVLKQSRTLIEQVNEHNAADLLKLVRVYAEDQVPELASATRAFVYSIDSLGFDVMVANARPDTPWTAFRLPFEERQRNLEDARGNLYGALEFAKSKID